MGYTTEFQGELKFKKELTASQLAHISQFLNHANPDEHPNWLRIEGDRYSYIQFVLTDNFDGIKWDGSEKFYNAVEAVNLIILNMRHIYPDFDLTGELQAQGEDIEDRWVLKVVDGKAVKVDQAVLGQKVTCPNCDENFILEAVTK